MSGKDQEILSRIHDLVSEEKSLRAEHHSRRLAPPQQERLEAVEVELDQSWDIIKQRRALSEIKKDPDPAHGRGEDTLEGYEQ
jgi:hypothetical protein